MEKRKQKALHKMRCKEWRKIMMKWEEERREKGREEYVMRKRKEKQKKRWKRREVQKGGRERE